MKLNRNSKSSARYDWNDKVNGYKDRGREKFYNNNNNHDDQNKNIKNSKYNKGTSDQG